MPYKITHKGGDYQVVNKDTGKKFSKHTTLPKAKSQMRLLEGIHYGMKLKNKHSK